MLNPVMLGQAIAQANNSAVDPKNIGTQVVKGLEATSLPVLQTGVRTQTVHTAHSPAAHLKHGSTSNCLPPKLDGNETIYDFIKDLPKLTGKVPHLGLMWNVNLLPRMVKERVTAARDTNAVMSH